MTKRDRERLQKVNRYSRPLLDALGISQTYRLDLAFVAEKDLSRDTANAGREIAAQVYGFFPYRALVVQVNRTWIDGASAKEVERVFMHEVLHPLLYDWVKHQKGCNVACKCTDVETLMEENTVDLVTGWLLKLGGQFQ